MSSAIGAAVARSLATYSFIYASEADLQAAAARSLAGDFPASTVRREVRLGSQAERIDMVLEAGAGDLERHGADSPAKVGIEVKVDGSAQAVRRQLERYAKTGKVSELILFTTKASHERELNREWSLSQPQGERAGCPLQVVRVRWL